MYIDHVSNFQVIHGLLDLLMTKVGAKFMTDYKLVEDATDPRWFNGGIAVMLGGKRVGSMGVLHPDVMRAYQLDYPVSAVELDFDKLFAHFLSKNGDENESTSE